MNLTVTSQTFTCVDRSDDPTPWLDGVLLNKYKSVTAFYFQKGTVAGGSLIFAASGNTITTSTENFNQFQIGETIKCPGSSSNTGTLTITGVSTSVLTVAESLTNETVDSFIFVTNLITGLDWLYNLIPVSQSAPSFYSITDPATQQKYIVSGISTLTGTPIYFTIGTASYAWVTDTLTGSTSQAYIVGDGISSTDNSATAYQQQFTITHYFFQTPLSGTQLPLFKQKTTPPMYPLTYCYGINAYYVGGTPIATASISGITPYGIAAWANQNNSGSIPEFTCTGITYQDVSSGLILPNPDFTKNNLVTITLKSLSGLFATGKTIIIGHLYIPQATKEYQNTTTTLRQNFIMDRCVQTIGGGAANGEFYGSNYSVLQNVVCALIDANTVTVTLNAIYAASLQTLLQSKPASNRNISIIADCEV